MISLIWAMDEKRLIGKDNKIPWRVKEDLLYFKEITNNQVVFMGFNTYMSLKGYYNDRPLPFKKIYLITRKRMAFPDATVVSNVDEFLSNTNEDIFVVGGAMLYEASFKYANKLYISYIKGEFEGDTYLADFDLSQFNLKSEKDNELVTYKVYERME
ncbi:MAG: dihydrofolate reductase [Anaeroplasmataceae bacterium]